MTKIANHAPRWSSFECATVRKVPRFETRCQVLTTRGGKSLDIQKSWNKATVLPGTQDAPAEGWWYLTDVGFKISH